MRADHGPAPVDNFWSALPAADAAALEALGRPRSFHRGQTLFHERQAADRVLVVRRGHVKVISTTSNGRDVLLAFRGPGDLVGDLAALDGDRVRPPSAPSRRSMRWHSIPRRFASSSPLGRRSCCCFWRWSSGACAMPTRR